MEIEEMHLRRSKYNRVRRDRLTLCSRWDKDFVGPSLKESTRGVEWLHWSQKLIRSKIHLINLSTEYKKEKSSNPFLSVVSSFTNTMWTETTVGLDGLCLSSEEARLRYQVPVVILSGLTTDSRGYAEDDTDTLWDTQWTLKVSLRTLTQFYLRREFLIQNKSVTFHAHIRTRHRSPVSLILDVGRVSLCAIRIDHLPTRK